ncbi:MAG: superoxide dismutase [Bacilli bacterium]|nr:superoxide dismutase [Bacilli bacterium]
MYEIIKLDYDYNALEPYIDGETVDIHYNKHHKGYLNKLNNILNSLNYKYEYSLVELINHIDYFPMNLRGDILYNAGGVLNHNLYWYNMSPHHNNQLVGKLKEDILNKYGSYDNFKEAFIIKANAVVGSGWTFLVIKPNGTLDIINTPNQETPYLYGFTPIIALDLWEHAYYLEYQNRRSDYINNFFEIIDYMKINELYEKNFQKQ